MSDGGSREPQGGRSAQRGFHYQNSLAANHLFELLFGENKVLSVSVESDDRVDDIVVRRQDEPVLCYYQVKDLRDAAKWTLRRLIREGILPAFVEQFRESGGRCRLILASPLALSPVSGWAEAARRGASLDEIREQATGVTSKDWLAFVDVLGSEAFAEDFLRSYFESRWPATPEEVCDIFLGSIDKVSSRDRRTWRLLRDFAANRAGRGERIERLDLLELLDTELRDSPPDLPLSDRTLKVIRLAAQEAWYVHRREEGDVLFAVADLLEGRPRNLLIVGDGGVGKSSFFNWIRRALRNEKGMTLVASAVSGEEPSDYLSRINEAISECLSSSRPSRAEAIGVVDEFLWYCAELRRRQMKLVLVLDGLEGFFSTLQIREAQRGVDLARHSILAAVERSQLSRSVLWILTSRTEYFLLTFHGQSALDRLNLRWVQLQSFSEQQARRLLRRLGVLSGKVFTENAALSLFENSGGSPQKIILAVLSFIRDFKKTTVDREDLETLRPWENVFEEDYENLEGPEKEVIYTLASLTLGSRRLEFRGEEIEQEVSARSDLTAQQVRTILRKISDAGVAIRQPTEDMYRLYHENFARFIVGKRGGIVETREFRDRFEASVKIMTHQMFHHYYELRSRFGSLQQSLMNLEVEKKGRLPYQIDELNLAMRRMEGGIESARYIANLGRVANRWQRVDLLTLIRDAARVFKSRARERRIDIRIAMEEPLTIISDARMLSWVLEHILDNALKYSIKQSEVVIGLRKEGSSLVLTIRNLGLQFDSDEPIRLFEPGFRGKRAQALVPRGTGMGLYLARNAIRGLGGDITLKQSPGRIEGSRASVTTFEVWLPMNRRYEYGLLESHTIS